jgi:hypothetical protein
MISKRKFQILFSVMLVDFIVLVYHLNFDTLTTILVGMILVTLFYLIENIYKSIEEIKFKKDSQDY